MVRPAYLANKTFKPVWYPVAKRGSVAAAGEMEWNAMAGILVQWMSIQPPERVNDGVIVCAPKVTMDWGNRLDGGKLGAFLFVAALIHWADVLAEIEDGTGASDWENMAADLVLVMRIRRQQVTAASVSTAREDAKKPEAPSGSGASLPVDQAEPQPAKRPRYVLHSIGVVQILRKAQAGVQAGCLAAGERPRYSAGAC